MSAHDDRHTRSDQLAKLPQLFHDPGIGGGKHDAEHDHPDPPRPGRGRDFLGGKIGTEVKDTLPLEHSPAIDGPGHHVQLRRDVQRVFKKLKPRERELLWLGHVEQFSHREIAEILGLKPGSIRLLLFRARRKLAAVLTEADLGPEVLQ